MGLGPGSSFAVQFLQIMDERNEKCDIDNGSKGGCSESQGGDIGKSRGSSSNNDMSKDNNNSSGSSSSSGSGSGNNGMKICSMHSSGNNNKKNNSSRSVGLIPTASGGTYLREWEGK